MGTVLLFLGAMDGASVRLNAFILVSKELIKTKFERVKGKRTRDSYPLGIWISNWKLSKYHKNNVAK